MRAIAALTLALHAGTVAYGQTAPTGDYHQHLFSPGIAALISPPAPQPAVDPIGADDLIRLLDVAGFNPLEDYALEELARCANDPHLRYGLKLHFGNSVVDYHSADHIARLQRVFRAANDYGMAIAVHMRASISQRMSYGRDEARIFLEELVPAAPDVPIQVAHLAGAGSYADPLIDEALSVFVAAMEARDPRTQRLYFDVTSVATPELAPERLELIAKRVRELGVQRILYGSDAASGTNLRPREGWARFREIPLTDAEFRTIASNVPIYMR